MLNVGVIGCGRWGPNYIRNLTEIGEPDVEAAADRDAGALNTLAQRFPGIGPVADNRELLGSEEIEAIVIATPASTHYEIARTCLEHGKHVLMEKPLASSSEEALSLARQDLAPGERRGKGLPERGPLR